MSPEDKHRLLDIVVMFIAIAALGFLGHQLDKFDELGINYDHISTQVSQCKQVSQQCYVHVIVTDSPTLSNEE